MSAPAALGSKVEKKGSLGYMRMPVACGGFSFLLYEWALSYVTSTPRITGADSALGSCRRRKIRCILADDDSRERCVTCIRLKKTCAFHPPDGQHNDTARFQTFNNAGPTASLSTTRSFSFARQNLGWALGRAEQLESPPTSSSSAPILFADPRFGPWSTLPNGSVYGSSGFENDLTLLFAFQPSFADGLEPWNHLNRFSSEETMDREDNVSQPSRLSNLMVSAEHCAKFPSAEAVAWLPSQYNMSASYPSWAMSCGQTYPSISQVKLPTSFSTMGQQSHPEPLQLGRSLCETSEPEEWISQDPLMNDITPNTRIRKILVKSVLG